MTRKPTPTDLSQFEVMLRKMLGILSGDIQNLASETLGDGLEAHNVSVEDAGGEINAMELSLELLERDENTVREIMDAIDRLKAGTFGRCEACEKWIRKTRLQAMPYARLCIDCQRSQEQESF